MIHEPVLLKEVMEVLDPKEGDLVIDGTAGAGGHAREISKRIGGNGKIFLFDWDPTAAAELEKEMRNFSGAKVINANYADIPDLVRNAEIPKVDCLLLDLGFSSDQLMSGRGFSFRESSGNEPLLMTYSDKQVPLRDSLKKLSEKEIFEIIRNFGEERYAKDIAAAIHKNRERIFTSGDLAGIIASVVPKSYERGRINPATRTFQAFRIYVNDEFGNIRKIIENIPLLMNKGGRVAVISFHSLEDAIVKEGFRGIEKEGIGERLNKKPIIAGIEEVAHNPRARSAKLRALKIL